MTSQYLKYKQQSVNSLTANEQLILLFEQASVNISKAISFTQKKDIVGAHESIIKTENIFYYLIDSLDMSFPISSNLLSLYNFIIDRLVQANIRKDSDILTEVQSLTHQLRDTWKEADLISRQGGT